MIGKTLGHYRIVERIGMDGMVEVYRARDERLERDVALKVLPEVFANDADGRARFSWEAQVLVSLNHPNIAASYGLEESEGVPCLVLEYVAGETLAEKLKSGPLPEKEIGRLGAEVGEALVEAHEHGVVHRDLKPTNIALTANGQVKVLNFGLAKLTQPVAPTATTEGFTEPQGVVGTLFYMAPEQLRGEGVDGRADLYSAGAVLYEMATGCHVFPGESVVQLTGAILHGSPISPRKINPHISSELERIILKCLAKEPEDRYQSARHLLRDLRQLSTRPSGEIPTPASHPSSAACLR